MKEQEEEKNICNDLPECEHEFIHVVYKLEKLDVQTFGKDVLGKGIVSNEHIKIYCSKCGTSKEI